MIKYLDRGGLAVEINGRKYEMTDLVDYSAKDDGYFSISGLINSRKFKIEASAPKKFFSDEDGGIWANEITRVTSLKQPFHLEDIGDGVAWLYDHIEFLVNGEEPDFNNGD